jgi:WD40 repeat protein
MCLCLQGHTARVTKVAFSPKNDTFITAAQVWQAAAGDSCQLTETLPLTHCLLCLLCIRAPVLKMMRDMPHNAAAVLGCMDEEKEEGLPVVFERLRHNEHLAASSCQDQLCTAWCYSSQRRLQDKEVQLWRVRMLCHFAASSRQQLCTAHSPSSCSIQAIASRPLGCRQLCK